MEFLWVMAMRTARETQPESLHRMGFPPYEVLRRIASMSTKLHSWSRIQSEDRERFLYSSEFVAIRNCGIYNLRQHIIRLLFAWYEMQGIFACNLTTFWITSPEAMWGQLAFKLWLMLTPGVQYWTWASNFVASIGVQGKVVPGHGDRGRLRNKEKNRKPGDVENKIRYSVGDLNMKTILLLFSWF